MILNSVYEYKKPMKNRALLFTDQDSNKLIVCQIEKRQFSDIFCRIFYEISYDNDWNLTFQINILVTI